MRPSLRAPLLRMNSSIAGWAARPSISSATSRSVTAYRTATTPTRFIRASVIPDIASMIRRARWRRASRSFETERSLSFQLSGDGVTTAPSASILSMTAPSGTRRTWHGTFLDRAAGRLRLPHFALTTVAARRRRMTLLSITRSSALPRLSRPARPSRSVLR